MNKYQTKDSPFYLQDVPPAPLVTPSLQQQVENLRLALLRNLGCGTDSKQPPYDPAVVEEICHANGAPTIFQELVQMMTPSRTDRACTNQKEENARKHAVSILYVMCYSQSQRCNWMQKDVPAFTHAHELSDTGITGIHNLGVSVNQQQLHTHINDAKRTHTQNINQLIEDATTKGHRISLMVDGCTNVHAICRPTSQQTVKVAHVATVVTHVFERPAIPASGPEIGPINDPAGVDIPHLLEEFQLKMPRILQTFAKSAPIEVLAHFFNAENERRRLTTHMYGENNNMRMARGVVNCHLIDCVEQPLKSVKNFRQATNIYIPPLENYLRRFAVLAPGGWLAQFYNRQIAYND